MFLVELTETEKSEALFKFDEVSKRHEKKKKKKEAPVPVVAVPMPEVTSVIEQPNQSKVTLGEIKVSLKSS